MMDNLQKYNELVERIARLEVKLENGLKADLIEIKDDLKKLLACVQQQAERTARLEETVANHNRIIWGIIISIALFIATSILAFIFRRLAG